MKKNVDTVELGFTDRRRTMDGPYRTVRYDQMFFAEAWILVLDKCYHCSFIFVIILATSGVVFIIECSIGAQSTLFTPIVNHEITCR